jgi:hypothetical protein
MTTSASLIGVTGSTGQLGGRVATRLAKLGQPPGYPQRLLVRNLARAPQLPGAEIVQASYEGGPSMRAALSGVQTLFLVSGYGQTRLKKHHSAINAAIAAGVERIVYTSFLAAAPLATFTHSREPLTGSDNPSRCFRLRTFRRVFPLPRAHRVPYVHIGASVGTIGSRTMLGGDHRNCASPSPAFPLFWLVANEGDISKQRGFSRRCSLPLNGSGGRRSPVHLQQAGCVV